VELLVVSFKPVVKPLSKKTQAMEIVLTTEPLAPQSDEDRSITSSDEGDVVIGNDEDDLVIASFDEDNNRSEPPAASEITVRYLALLQFAQDARVRQQHQRNTAIYLALHQLAQEAQLHQQNDRTTANYLVLQELAQDARVRQQDAEQARAKQAKLDEYLPKCHQAMAQPDDHIGTVGIFAFSPECLSDIWKKQSLQAASQEGNDGVCNPMGIFAMDSSLWRYSKASL